MPAGGANSPAGMPMGSEPTPAAQQACAAAGLSGASPPSKAEAALRWRGNHWAASACSCRLYPCVENTQPPGHAPLESFPKTARMCRDMASTR
jgi:hypothetical protein